MLLALQPSAQAVALDGEAVHVMYASFASPFNHATKQDGVWANETIASDLRGDTMFSRLAIDRGGALHLAYQLGGSGVAYATNGTADGAWIITGLAAYQADSTFGFALDAAGVGHLVYAGGGFSTYQRFAPPNGLDDDCDGTIW
jgi:hypothetical protein